jgi:hypothetical protein
MGSISCCNQSFHWSWLMCFLFVICFRCLPCQLNCVWDVTEYSIRTLHTTPKPPWLSPFNNRRTFLMLGINNTPRFSIWATNLIFFFKNLACHEIFFHKLATFVV